jgi:DNA polymerase-4
MDRFRPDDETMTTKRPGLRKIIHVDMDAFFASVEQRDDPALRGKPVAVGGDRRARRGGGGSYEARKFGVRSAMPSVPRAARLCPDLIFKKPRFEVYRRSASRSARSSATTPRTSSRCRSTRPISMSPMTSGIGSATRIAELIRRRIRAETGLTASAGVSYNKFLAKLASDQNKPDGLCVIRPGEGAAFVAALPVRRFHGVGPRGAEKMARLGIETGADLAAKDIAFLRKHFGSRPITSIARRAGSTCAGAGRPAAQVGGRRAHFHENISNRANCAIRSRQYRRHRLGPDRGGWDAGADGDAQAALCRFHHADPRPLAAACSGSRTRGVCQRLGRALLDDVMPLPQPVRLMGLTLSALEGEREPDEGGAPEGQLTLL